ncbi:bifunctional 3-(3-hydroxy-phenyl)propionate/3-hydroxycinnamic acid hydroxylase [Arthrobacter sp. GMC3]|uniref:bifunctional 3-(3-hydroxy-phenyl)propionate/3-hydroxycinnamic acid hydroxylase MhpA n=1 Tax=Arthrobacter sp. GMC3 TaxID=2058894 RepID=UPI0015E299D8|nr:bifunctional 3-(3-hydroxy-phenyl)propionate/3-hydroxycinnamic acid hydroxylase [Arthrobacter sp. GMC3]
MSSTPTHTTVVDVLIIGMGPVGKMAGLLLARAGHTVTVVDHRESDYPLPRAVGHDSEIARLFQSAGLPVDLMAEAVDSYDDLYIWANGRDEVLQELDISGTGPSGWGNMYFYHQPSLEARLDAALRSYPGVTVRRGVRAAVAAQDERGVDVELSPIAENGAGSVIRAGYVLAADGANGSTRKDLGIKWHDLGYFFDWLVVDIIPGPDAKVTHLAKQVCDPARPTTVVPAGPGRRRWEFMLKPEDDPSTIVQPENIWKLLEPFGINTANSQMERGVVYTFAAAWAEKWRSGRVFLLGDAAHLMPPFAAQGLASGFRDGLNLSWKLDLVLRGKAGDALLDSYDSERIPQVNGLIDFSMALAQVICISDPQIAAARDEQMIAAMKSGAAPAPLPTPKLGPGVHVGEHGGELSRQGMILTSNLAAPARFDDVYGAGALILRGAEMRDALTAEDTARLAEVGIAVAVFAAGCSHPGSFSDVEGSYARWFQEWQTGAILIRADFSVFGTASNPADVSELVAGLLEALHARVSPRSQEATA